MTRVTVTKKAGHIVKVSCMGHTGFGTEGEDIVCAAVSSVIQTALLGLLRVASLDVKYSSDDEAGMLEFTLPAEMTDDERRAADIILDTMCLGIADLVEGFSKFIALKTVKA